MLQNYIFQPKISFLEMWGAASRLKSVIQAGSDSRMDFVVLESEIAKRVVFETAEI